MVNKPCWSYFQCWKCYG